MEEIKNTPQLSSWPPFEHKLTVLKSIDVILVKTKS